MKTLKLTALASALFALGTVASPSTSVAAGNPDNGVHCPAGFDAQFAGGALKCVKPVTLDLTNTSGRECTQDAPFDNFQKMSQGQRDICVHRDSNIPGNANLAEFENGQVLIVIPVNAVLPRNLLGRQPVKVVNGLRFFRVNENADFIFYDRSKTISSLAAGKAKAVEVATQRQLNVPSEEVNSRVASITTSQADFSGSLDKIEGKVNLTTFARP
jgi:hypothetical protein